MKPEPFKDVEFKDIKKELVGAGIDEEDIIKLEASTVAGVTSKIYKDRIKSAVEYREQLFRKKVTERTYEGAFEDKEKISIQEIMDISREVDKITFEDVVKKCPK